MAGYSKFNDIEPISHFSREPNYHILFNSIIYCNHKHIGLEGTWRGSLIKSVNS